MKRPPIELLKETGLKNALLRHVCICLLMAGVVFMCEQPRGFTPPPISLSVSADSTVLLRDTFTVKVTAEDAATDELLYCWQREGTHNVDTTDSGRFQTVFDFPDTGMQRIAVWVVDEGRGKESAVEIIEVRVNYLLPEVNCEGESEAVVNEPVVYHAIAADNDGSIDHFEWLVGDRPKIITKAEDDQLVVKWTIDEVGEQAVRLYAVDNDGIKSDPASLDVDVSLPHPDISISGDTVVTVNDTVTYVAVIGDDTVGVHSLQWSTDRERKTWLSMPGDTFVQIWKLPDSGSQVVQVRAVDADGLASDVVSLDVHVSACIPVMELDGPEIVLSDDSVTYSADAHDSDGTVVSYTWVQEINGGIREFTTEDPELAVSWARTDAGTRTVSVAAVDDDGMVSSTERLAVTVKDGNPVFVHMNDTTISSRDTLKINRTLVDTSLEVEFYYWDLDGDGKWNDSTESETANLVYENDPEVMVIMKAMDKKGRFFQDTVLVAFNRPPVIDLLTSVNQDTVWVPQHQMSSGIPFEYTVSDEDYDYEASVIVWDGDSVTCSPGMKLPVSSLGEHEWHFVAKDEWGNRTVQSGTIIVGRQFSICFAGHGIVSGMKGEQTTGGFRRAVLDGLRNRTETNERIHPVGPLRTGLMTATPADDSCLATDGMIAREALALLEHGYTDLSADIWVVMLGVNGLFSSTEMQSVAAVLNRMLNRNNNARVYVILAPPHTEETDWQRTTFNNYLLSNISNHNENGAAVYAVRADSVLADPDDDTVIDSTLFDSDGKHPNQDGYDVLADEIQRVMFNGLKPVLYRGN